MMGYCGVLNVAIDHVRGFNGAPHQVIFILVLSTATPQVDYRERLVAVGQLPSRADRRDPGGTEREVLGARLVDRALRPLLPPGWAAPTQVGRGEGGGRGGGLHGARSGDTPSCTVSRCTVASTLLILPC